MKPLFAYRQQGLVTLLAASAILVSVVTIMVIEQANAVRAAGNRTNLTQKRLELIRQSVVNFVFIQGRLPCPAATNADGGLSDPPGSVAACVSPVGTVPWSDLGLPRSESFDGWGRKISFRVYRPDNLNLPGLSIRVRDAAIGLVPGVAFVLISHGGTGYGAWLEGGSQFAELPSAGNLREAANLQTAPPAIYHRWIYSAKTIAPAAANHFDDEVVYMTVTDLRIAARR